MHMKDFVKIEQLEDVVTQMNAVFKLLEGRIEKLEEAAAKKPLSRKPAKKEAENG